MSRIMFESDVLIAAFTDDTSVSSPASNKASKLPRQFASGCSHTGILIDLLPKMHHSSLPDIELCILSEGNFLDVLEVFSTFI